MTFQSELNISLFHLCIQRTWKKMARWVAIALHSSQSLREKCPNTELFLLRIFLHSDWIRRFRIELEVESMTKVAEQLILTVMREFYSLKSSRMRQLVETGKWKHLCSFQYMRALTKLLKTNRLWPCGRDNFKITNLMLSLFSPIHQAAVLIIL